MRRYAAPMPTPTDLLRAVVDPLRLAILGRAAGGALDVDAVAADLGEDRRAVLEAAGRLRAAGLLDDELRLDREALRSVAADLPREAPPSATVLAGDWSEEDREVLGRFFTGSRLHTIPTSRAKRLLVLERLAQEFEVGVRYPERQVDFMLQMFHPDYASLRRFLVDEELLTRADGVYWRTGGRVADE